MNTAQMKQFRQALEQDKAQLAVVEAWLDRVSANGRGVHFRRSSAARRVRSGHGEKRVTNGQLPLWQVCIKQLRATGPMNSADLAAKILSTGYRTSSKGFTNMLYQCMASDRKRFVSKAGVWHLKKGVVG